MNYEYFREAPPVIQEFMAYMDNVKGRSGLSVDEYYRDLRTFFRFLLVERGRVPKDIDFQEIDISVVDLDFIKTVTFADILLFMNYCQNERDNNADSRARKTSSLKTLEESLRLLQAVDGTHKERDYCILTFFLNCGMRVSELVGINLSDINTEHMLKIRGKGNKERVLYLNDACVDAMDKYMQVRSTEGVKDKDALFISQKKVRMTQRAVQELVEKYINKIGLDGKGYSPHKLRHTAATLMYQKGGVDIRTLQIILGHTSVGTTQIYTHVAEEQVISGLKANPLAKKK